MGGGGGGGNMYILKAFHSEMPRLFAIICMSHIIRKLTICICKNPVAHIICIVLEAMDCLSKYR